MNKRETLLRLVHDATPPDHIPAAFFLHFDSAYHTGPAAVAQHLAYFRATGMDFVKIQFEQPAPPGFRVVHPEDWARVPRMTEAFFEPTVQVVRGLVTAVRAEALIVLTVYSPLMWAARFTEPATLAEHFRSAPEAVAEGLAVLTENVITLVRAGRRAGLDGFYISTQGGEAARFAPGVFGRYIQPTDLAVWAAAHGCEFNLLHLCDYVADYADLTPFLAYPGAVVNASLKVGDRHLRPREMAQLFNRPFMGGLERKGALATGPVAAIHQAVAEVLAEAPARFILGADCTVPAETPWAHLQTAIAAAHAYRR